MKIKINKTSSGYLLSILLLIIATIFSVTIIYEYIKYKQSNPPTEICKNNNLNNKNGLLLHWSFEDIVNDTIKDHSGNNNSGQIKSALTIDFPHRLVKNDFDINYFLGLPEIVKGVKGKAIKLNGRQFISGGNLAAYNTGIFTISIWVWRESIGWEVPTIMSKGSWPWFDGWWLCTKSSDEYIDMGIAWGTSFTHIESGYKLPLKEWHHLVVTMNNKEHEIQFYIDGIIFGEKHRNVHEWLVNWNHELYVGDYDGSARWPWDGRLDEVRYYNRILDENEIYNIYEKEKNIILSKNQIPSS